MSGAWHSHFRLGNRSGRYFGGRSRGQSPGDKPQESWRNREEPPSRTSDNALERQLLRLSETRLRKRMREGTGSRFHGVRRTLWRGPKTHESIGLSGLRPGSGTDPRREQRLGAAGHHDLLVLRAGECDVRNGKRAQAPKGVRICEGEKLCRVNPTSGTDPRDRKACEGGSRQEGEKP